MSKSSRPTTEKATAVYRLPVWLVRAVKFDAARQGINYSRFAETVLARSISPESRRLAECPEPAAAQ